MNNVTCIGVLDVYKRQALKEGYPQAQVKAVLDERFKNLAFRKDVAVGNNMYANMTEELLDPKPENQETLRQKRVAQIEEYLASAEPDAVVKAQATLCLLYTSALILLVNYVKTTNSFLGVL